MYASIFLLFTSSSEYFETAFHIYILSKLDTDTIAPCSYRFGSANVLFMASTVMVPIGNLAFALPFMPGSTPLKDSDVAGLMVILLGLVTYRFGNTFKCGSLLSHNWRTIPPLPWRRGKTRYRRDPGILNEFEWDAPVFDDENESDSIGLRAPSSLLEEPLLTPVQ